VVITGFLTLGFYWIKTRRNQYEFNESWTTIASSSTGQYVAAASSGRLIHTGDIPGGMFVSSDYGIFWREQTSAPFSSTDSDSSYYWTSITMDATGQYLAAISQSYEGYYDGQNSRVYSSNDYGSSWKQASSSCLNSCNAIKSDATGAYLVATTGGYICTSNDYGSTWKQTSAPSIGWSSIASDATGQYLAATGRYLYTSNDYGVTWKNTSSLSFRDITSDATGKYLAAISNEYSTLYTSNDYGVSWKKSPTPWSDVGSITSDSSGQYLAIISSCNIYTSSDYGGSWTQAGSPDKCWTLVTSDASGKRLFAVDVSNEYDESDEHFYIFSSDDYGASWKLGVKDLNCVYPFLTYTAGLAQYYCDGVQLDPNAEVSIALIVIIAGGIYLWAHLWIEDKTGKVNTKLGLNLAVYTFIPAVDMMSTLIMLLTTLFASIFIFAAAWLAFFAPAAVFAWQLKRNETYIRRFPFVWLIPIPGPFVFEEYNSISKVLVTSVVGAVPFAVSFTWFALRNSFFIFQAFWLVFGYFLFSIKVLCIGKVECLWYRVFTGNAEPIHHKVVNLRQLNEQYLSITILQSLPTLFVIAINSWILGTLTDIQVFSLSFSAMMVIASIYRYAYYAYKSKPISNVPIPSTLFFDVDLSNYEQDEADIPASSEIDKKNVTMSEGIEMDVVMSPFASSEITTMRKDMEMMKGKLQEFEVMKGKMQEFEVMKAKLQKYDMMEGKLAELESLVKQNVNHNV
jgi:photosystem II stability/assembly factor-like uncharacterized protein